MTMAKLPTTYVEAVKAQALTRAKSMVASWRDDRGEMGEMIGSEFFWLDKAESRRAIVELFKFGALTYPDVMMRLVDKAWAGFSVAQDVLGELEREFLHRGEPPPPYLAAYLMDRSANRGAPRRKSGPGGADFFFRDIAVTGLVGEICREFGLKPYRDLKGRKNPSGCSVVGEALGKSEEAIAAIWGKYGHIAFPDL